MQFKSLALMFVIAGLFGCTQSVKEVVEETHPNGKPKKVNYKKGRNPFRTVFYFENGNIQSEQFFDKAGEERCDWLY